MGYGVRNLFGGPGRALTLVGLTVVVVLIFVVVGFIRGWSRAWRSAAIREASWSLHWSQRKRRNSSIPAATTALLCAQLEGILRRPGTDGSHIALRQASCLSTQVRTDPELTSMGIVGGVTPAALLVRRKVRILEADGLGPAVLTGRLSAAKLGLPANPSRGLRLRSKAVHKSAADSLQPGLRWNRNFGVRLRTQRP